MVITQVWFESSRARHPPAVASLDRDEMPRRTHIEKVTGFAKVGVCTARRQTVSDLQHIDIAPASATQSQRQSALDWVVPRRTTALLSALLVAALLGATATVQAQFRRGGGGRGGFGFTARTARPKDFDGLFHFCRIIFRNSPEGDGNGWSVDWPRA